MTERANARSVSLSVSATSILLGESTACVTTLNNKIKTQSRYVASQEIAVWFKWSLIPIHNTACVHVRACFPAVRGQPGKMRWREREITTNRNTPYFSAKFAFRSLHRYVHIVATWATQPLLIPPPPPAHRPLNASSLHGAKAAEREHARKDVNGKKKSTQNGERDRHFLFVCIS